MTGANIVVTDLSEVSLMRHILRYVVPVNPILVSIGLFTDLQIRSGVQVRYLLDDSSKFIVNVLSPSG